MVVKEFLDVLAHIVHHVLGHGSGKGKRQERLSCFFGEGEIAQLLLIEGL